VSQVTFFDHIMFNKGLIERLLFLWFALIKTGQIQIGGCAKACNYTKSSRINAAYICKIAQYFHRKNQQSGAEI